MSHQWQPIEDRALLFCLLAGYSWEDIATDIPGRSRASFYDRRNLLLVSPSQGSPVFDPRVNTGETGLKNKLAKEFGQSFPQGGTTTEMCKAACQYIQHLEATICELHQHSNLLKNAVGQGSLKLNCPDGYCDEPGRNFENMTKLLDHFLNHISVDIHCVFCSEDIKTLKEQQEHTQASHQDQNKCSIDSGNGEQKNAFVKDTKDSVNQARLKLYESLRSRKQPDRVHCEMDVPSCLPVDDYGRGPLGKAQLRSSDHNESTIFPTASREKDGTLSTKTGDNLSGRTRDSPPWRSENPPGRRTSDLPGGRTDFLPDGRSDLPPNGRSDLLPGGRSDNPPGRRTSNPPGGRTDFPLGGTSNNPPGRTGNPSSRNRVTKRRKEQQPRRTFTACARCKDQKIKCSGSMPSCEKCLKKRLKCTYRSQVPSKQQRISTTLAAKQPMNSVTRDTVHDLASSLADTPITHQLSSTNSWASSSFESADQARPLRMEAIVDLAQPAAMVLEDGCCPQADVPPAGYPEHTQHASQITNGLDPLMHDMNMDYSAWDNHETAFSRPLSIFSDSPTNIPWEPETAWTDLSGSNTDDFHKQCSMFALSFSGYP